jgi:hypothetical protein
MARTHRRTLAALALVALPVLAVLPLLPGCKGDSAPPADCSLKGTKTWMLQTAESYYLYESQVDFTKFDPADATQTLQQFLDAIVDSANAPDKGRGFTYTLTREASAQYFDAGQAMGYGFGYRPVGDLALGNGQFFVTYVLGDDPSLAVALQGAAFKAGFTRGDQLQAVALDQAKLGDAASQLSAILQASATTDPSALSKALGTGSDTVPRWFRLLHAGAVVPVDVTATRAVYAINPVPATTILTTGSHKVGFITLRTFIVPAEAALRTAFAAFKAAGVTDLIVDLRYDGGGRLNTAAIFLDLLRGGHAGDFMFSLNFNALHPGDNASAVFATEPSALSTSVLAPTRVAFIGTSGTASASEIVPFALLPYPDVQVALVGSRTYGKPVGQGGWSVAACPDELYLLAFQLANKNGLADYFGGLPDAAFTAAGGSACAAADDLTHPTGDVAEASTAAALAWIADGTTCLNGPIAAAASMPLASMAPAPWLLEPPEPTLAQRHLPGLF